MLYLKAAEIVEPLAEHDGRKGKFIKTFALNDKRNKNGWRVTWESIKAHIASFIGMPGIEFVKCEKEICDLDHTEGSTYEASLKAQEPYRVSDIVGFQLDETTHTAYFIHEFKDDDAYERAKNGQLKFVSPSIWPAKDGWDVLGTMENGLPMLDVHDWKGLHDAFVTNPAFGDDAKVTAACEGEGCPVRLLAANNSLSGCACSRSLEMTGKTPEEQVKDLSAKVEELTAQNKDLSAKLKEALKANEEMNEKEEEEEAEETQAKGKAKSGKTEPVESDTVKQLKAQVADLDAQARAPLVAKMVSARESAGASEEDIEAFKASIKDKSFAEIKAMSASEDIFYKSLEARAQGEHFDFEGGVNSGALQAKSLEEIFGEGA